MYAAITRIVRNTNRRIDVRIVCVFPITRPIETVIRQALSDERNIDQVSARILLVIVEIAVIHEFDFDIVVEEGWQFDAVPDAAVLDSSIPPTNEVDLLAFLHSHICIDARYTVEKVLIPFRGSFGSRLISPVDVGLGESVAKYGGSVDGFGEFIGFLVRLGIGEVGEEDERTLGSNESVTDLVVAGIVACCGAGVTVFGGYLVITITFSQASQRKIVFGQWSRECC